MLTVTLPALVAGRDLADAFVDPLTGVDGNPVTVDARELTSGTASFAAQLVRRILVDAHGQRLVLLGAPDTFVGYARDAARKLHVTDRLDVLDSLAEAV